MRVLILSHRIGPEWSVAAERVRTLETWIREAGHHPLLLTTEDRREASSPNRFSLWGAFRTALSLAWDATALAPVHLVVAVGHDSSVPLAARLCLRWRGWPFLLDPGAGGEGPSDAATQTSPLSRWFANWVRRRSTAEAAAVLTASATTEGATALQRPTGTSGGPPAVSLPNGVDLKSWRPEPRFNPFRRLWNSLQRFVCGTPGGPIGSTHAQTLLAAATRLRDLRRDDVHFWVLPESADCVDWERTISQRGLSNVRVVARPPRASLPGVIGACDAWFCSPSQVSGGELRSDLLSILAMNVPVLAPVRGTLLDRILDADAGLGVVPGSPESLIDALQELREFPSACRVGRRHVAAFHDESIVSARWQELVREHALPDTLPQDGRIGVRPPRVAPVWPDREAA